MSKVSSSRPSVKSPRRRPRRSKVVYRVRNWSTYEAGLKQRGSLTDSTGLKVYGEGEWKVRQHGWTQRRTGRKLHLTVNAATGKIVAQTLTPPGQDDASQVEPLLKQVEAPIDALAEPQQGPPIRPIIPPRKDAKIEQHGNTQAEPLARDETLRAIRKRGRRGWKQTRGYHRRSLAETQMFRYKRIIGPGLQARNLANQQTESLF